MNSNLPKDCPIGFGGGAIGNLFHRVDDATARATVDAALDLGVRYFDTAPHYGRGLSERRIGEALRGHANVVVSTKIGRLLTPDPTITDDSERDGFLSPMPFRASYDYSHDGVLRSFEASLQRLGLGRVDILLVHDIGQMVHGAADEIYWQQLTQGGGFDALIRLRDEGAIAAFGLGVNEIPASLKAIEIAPIDLLLLAGRYTLLEQEPLDALFPACAKAGVEVVVGGPYNSGILVTGTRSGDAIRYNYDAASNALIERVARMETIAAAHDVPLPAAALAFVLAHPVVASVIPGLGHPDHVRQTMAWHSTVIPDDFWAELRHEGLIRPDAPVPDQMVASHG
jgi:D-threo-aldose 1-dehydrogenase